jgi:ubiquinone/menaquinone biosynthesis C-methylase UbiE
MVTDVQIDQARSEAFAGKVIGNLNAASVTLMTSLGHRTGLFDVMDGLPASTSEQIAGAASLNERYVREWLGAMVTGGIVEYDPNDATYTLPAEHAAHLTRAAGPGNLAAFSEVIPMLAPVQDKLEVVFRAGGGLPYSEYARFHDFMAEISGQRDDGILIDGTLNLVPGLKDRLASGIDVADVGCGSGHAINLMAQAFPTSRFTGIDFSEEGIANGKAEAASLGLENASFVLEDAATLAGPPSYDLITTFDSVHDQARPDLVLKGIADSLRPGGTYLCVDIQASSDVAKNLDHPLAPMIYTVSTMHCMTVSLALDGMGLGAAWGNEKATEMIAAAGFTDIDVKNVEGDIMNAYYIATKA